jgi:hypothetical protein
VERFKIDVKLTRSTEKTIIFAVLTEIIFVKLNCIFLIISFLSCINWNNTAIATEPPLDSLPYRYQKHRFTLYGGLGFNSTIISYNLKYDNHGKIDLVPNNPFLLEVGAAFRGFSLGLTFRLPFYTLSVKDYGKTNYFDSRFKFAIKRVNFSVDLYTYKGFAYLNQQQKDTVALPNKHGLHPNYNTTSLAVNMRYFFKKEMHYKSVLGIHGYYEKPTWSPYLYGYIGGINVRNGGDYLLPDFQRTDSLENSNAIRIGAFELGAIPGFAYVYRKNWFQGGIILGFGPLLQVKSYETRETSRSFVGLNARTDLQLSLGVQKDKWFMMLNSEFLFRNITIRNIDYQQYLFDIRLVAGLRFKEKLPKKVKQ